MKKGLTELVMILDRSGSMSGLEADTIGGFNSLIDKQKKEEGEAYVSVVLFDDRSEVLYDRVDIRKIEPMNDKQYYVRGCTALLDAVGGAIHHISTVHKYARKEDVPEKTIFIITTDGMENASHQYTYEKVRRMIERRKEQYHWEFMFLGANIDAVKEAKQAGSELTHPGRCAMRMTAPARSSIIRCFLMWWAVPERLLQSRIWKRYLTMKRCLRRSEKITKSVTEIKPGSLKKRTGKFRMKGQSH